MLRYAERKKLKKPAAPICLPFLLDGLGSREVFLVKTAWVYRVETRITIRNTECRNVTRKRGGNIKILRISETREKITGKRTIHNDYVCLSSGDPSGKHGVAFIVTRNINNNIDMFKPVDNRIACMKLRLNNTKVIVVNVYAPQQGRPEEEK